MSISPLSLPGFTAENLNQKPIEQAETIPSAWYTSDAVLKLEKEIIFSSFWQLACHQSRIPEPGDIYALEIAGNPILVLRNGERQLKAFFNVCKHRGGPLAIKKGTTSVLQCQYHGWTYKLDGSLRGVPQFNRVDLFDKKDFGLVPVDLITREGLIFLRLRPKSPNLSVLLKEMYKYISPIKLSDFKFSKDQTYTVNCNWKVYVDNFLEGYHIPIVHPELAKLLDYREYNTRIHPWYSLQHSPLKAKEGIYKSGEGEALYFFVFPNIMLNILPGRLQINIIRPTGVDTTEVLFSYCYLETESTQAQKIMEEDIRYSHDIQLEDIEICELVQKGLNSFAYDKGRFSVEREQGVYHFQSLLKKVFGKSLAQSDPS